MSEVPQPGEPEPQTEGGEGDEDNGDENGDEETTEAEG